MVYAQTCFFSSLISFLSYEALILCGIDWPPPPPVFPHHLRFGGIDLPPPRGSYLRCTLVLKSPLSQYRTNVTIEMVGVEGIANCKRIWIYSHATYIYTCVKTSSSDTPAKPSTATANPSASDPPGRCRNRPFPIAAATAPSAPRA